MKIQRWLRDINLSGLRSIAYVWFVPPALLIGGFQELYTIIRYSSPVTYRLEEYWEARHADPLPDEKWLTLTDATLDFSSATYASFPVLGIVTDVYIPVFPSQTHAEDCRHQPTSECIHVLVTTQSRKLINAAQRSEEEMRSQDISGMVKFGILGITSDRQRWLDSEYNGRLASGITVIELDAQPNRWRTAGFLAGGTALGLWLLKPRLAKH